MTKTNKAAKITETGNPIFPISIPLPPGTMDGNGWENQEAEELGTPIPTREELAAHNTQIDLDGEEMKAARAWSEQMRKDLAS